MERPWEQLGLAGTVHGMARTESICWVSAKSSSASGRRIFLQIKASDTNGHSLPHSLPSDHLWPLLYLPSNSHKSIFLPWSQRKLLPWVPERALYILGRKQGSALWPEQEWRWGNLLRGQSVARRQSKSPGWQRGGSRSTIILCTTVIIFAMGAYQLNNKGNLSL